MPLWSQRWNFFAPSLPRRGLTLEYHCGDGRWMDPAAGWLALHRKVRVGPQEKALMLMHNLSAHLLELQRRGDGADIRRYLRLMDDSFCDGQGRLSARVNQQALHD